LIAHEKAFGTIAQVWFGLSMDFPVRVQLSKDRFISLVWFRCRFLSQLLADSFLRAGNLMTRKYFWKALSTFVVVVEVVFEPFWNALLRDFARGIWHLSLQGYPKVK
jgi:hypothetical protein